MEIDKSAGEVGDQGHGGPASQAPASEVGGGSPAAAGSAQNWKVGDQTYNDPHRMADDFRRFQGDYTRSRQEYAKFRDESAVARTVWDIIKQNPQYAREVQGWINAGKTPQQAAQKVAEEHQADPRLDQMYGEFETLKQERASEAFEKSHPDLKDQDKELIADWIEENSDWLDQSGLDYQQILNLAWNEYFIKHRSQTLVDQGARMVEDQVRRGEKSKVLGSAAPSAKSAPQPRKRGNEMSVAERHEHALGVFKASARAGK